MNLLNYQSPPQRDTMLVWDYYIQSVNWIAKYLIHPSSSENVIFFGLPLVEDFNNALKSKGIEFDTFRLSTLIRETLRQTIFEETGKEILNIRYVHSAFKHISVEATGIRHSYLNLLKGDCVLEDLNQIEIQMKIIDKTIQSILNISI